MFRTQSRWLGTHPVGVVFLLLLGTLEHTQCAGEAVERRGEATVRVGDTVTRVGEVFVKQSRWLGKDPVSVGLLLLLLGVGLFLLLQHTYCFGEAVKRRGEAIVCVGDTVTGVGEAVERRGESMVCVGEAVTGLGKDPVGVGLLLLLLGALRLLGLLGQGC